jgi:hypothetical protein
MPLKNSKRVIEMGNAISRRDVSFTDVQANHATIAIQIENPTQAAVHRSDPESALMNKKDVIAAARTTTMNVCRFRIGA